MFFGQTRADIPVGCDYVVQLSGGYRGVLINAAEKSKTVPFVSSQISDTLAVRIVRTLAPVCTDEVSLEGELIKNISMFKMLNILSVEDLDLKARWSASKVTKSMAAPVGVSKTGIVMLDLHDKAHGPHGLVAGTTGSGKSEILQTYILSMATLYHPYEAAFVIIDFKGGGMVCPICLARSQILMGMPSIGRLSRSKQNCRRDRNISHRRTSTISINISENIKRAK